MACQRARSEPAYPVHAKSDCECRGPSCVALQDAPVGGGRRSRRYSRRELLIHQPAHLDEQPVRVGVLLLRAVELFHAHDGLLVAQAHATQESLHPPTARTDVESLCVEPSVHQAPDRLRAEAQDVGHSHDVLAEPCHVRG